MIKEFDDNDIRELQDIVRIGIVSRRKQRENDGKGKDRRTGHCNGGFADSAEYAVYGYGMERRRGKVEL